MSMKKGERLQGHMNFYKNKACKDKSKSILQYPIKKDLLLLISWWTYRRKFNLNLCIAGVLAVLQGIVMGCSKSVVGYIFTSDE